MDKSMTDEKKQRWYDHDPLLIEVLELLRTFEADVHQQAEMFISKIEEQVGPDALEKFYQSSRPKTFGNRWYDQDPVISKAVELLRVVPQEVQRQAAVKFLESMKKQGISPEVLKQAEQH